MILSDKTIREMIEEGQIVILPEFDMKDIRPVGIRLHLSKDLLIPEPDQIIDIEKSSEVKYKKIEMNEEGFVIRPGEFILGATYERFQVPRDIVCRVDGRSTIGRLGLTVHCTAETVDGNFEEPRDIVLEMKNIGSTDLILRPKLAIAMVTFSKLSSPIEQKSQIQYKGQVGVVGANLKIQEK